jgi:hypothetical protein
MLLTQQERKRFAEWLEQDIGSNGALISQFDKLGPHLKQLKELKIKLVEAEKTVLKEIQSVEAQTIGR